ncbi:MAG TPA: sugar phosphate nucleotidyltransferase [Bryobacteraceae bacterium]|nr:sugar phosphate nucleotidyltransferase [Bryobacteraceae bacterium]
MSHDYGLILAGGRGTRFWPRSRRSRAKQVLKIFGEQSLIQSTVDRLSPLIPPERLWVLTNEHLREEIVRQLPSIPRRQILAEPMQRNTAPAIGLAAHILHSLDRDAVMGVFPADHVIAKPRRYLQFARAGFRAAAHGKIAVLGVIPRWAETGYGYVEFPRGTRSGSLDPVLVTSFREKPDSRTASKYLAAKRFYWNAGMFFWRADILLAALRRHLPKTATLLAALPAFSGRQFQTKLAQVFPRCENISIDYAVLERANNVVGFACDDIGWNDVGSWNAVYELVARDRDGNAARSVVISSDSSGNYIDAGNKLVALLGAHNLVVVDTPDALLIADRERAQQVGDIVKLLEQNRRNDLL